MTRKSSIYSKAAKRYWAYKDELRLKAGQFKLGECYEVIFYIQMPKSWSKKKKNEMIGQPHQQRPDADNLNKALKDILCEEDSYVWGEKVTKLWAETGAIQITNIERESWQQQLEG